MRSSIVNLFFLLLFSSQLLAKNKLVHSEKIARHTFEIGARQFLYDGDSIVIKCGEMHFARIPREYWRHRIQMAKAMGLNTVSAYLFWNKHEPKPDTYDWTGMADAAEFCKIAQSEGMMVILRPGPYVCGEWDYGGLPWWLLKNPDLKIRSNDDAFYLERVRKYFNEVGRVLAPLQITNGGPIIMCQVENEWAFWDVKDGAYIRTLKTYLQESGFNIPFYTCDYAGLIHKNPTPEIFNAVNFGSNPAWAFSELRKVRKAGPLMNSEYYPAWYDRWGSPHQVGSVSKIVDDLKYMVDNYASFSLYMAHGGTTWGMWNSARPDGVAPLTTSYDYDAPISESGDVTPKFTAIRNLLSAYIDKGKTLADIPVANKKIHIPAFRTTETAPLIESLGSGIKECVIRNMEQYDYGYGCINYRTVIPAGNAAVINIVQLRDHATVFLDGMKIGTTDNRFKVTTCKLPPRTKSATLDIFVEVTGRTPFGKSTLLNDVKKGITQKVEYTEGTKTIQLSNWTVFPMPLKNDKAPVDVKFKFGTTKEPAFHRAIVNLADTGDCFLDMSEWGKGLVWVNGHCLGRFWRIGPTQTMYVPGPWLKKGRNEIIIMDVIGQKDNVLVGLTTPILDVLQEQPKVFSIPGQKLNLAGVAAVDSGFFSNSPDFASVMFKKPENGRFFCFASINRYNGAFEAALAELQLLDKNGFEIPRDSFKLIFVNSENVEDFDGSAENALDGQGPTFWITKSKGNNSSTQYYFVLDLGREYEIGGFKILPRQDKSNGRTKDYKVYLSPTIFDGIDLMNTSY